MPVTTTSSSLAGLEESIFLTGLGALVAGLGGLLTGLGGSAVEPRCSTVGLGGAGGCEVSTSTFGSTSGGLASASWFCAAELSMEISAFLPSCSGVFSGSTSSVGSLVLAFLLNRALALQHQRLEYGKPTNEINKLRSNILT